MIFTEQRPFLEMGETPARRLRMVKAVLLREAIASPPRTVIAFTLDCPVDPALSAAQLLSIVSRLYRLLPAEPSSASIAQIRRYADRYRQIVEGR